MNARLTPRLDPVTEPLFRLAVAASVISPQHTLRLAAARLAEEGLGAIPVIQDHQYVGLITERDLARALASGATPDDIVEPWVRTQDPTLSPAETGAAALRTMVEHELSAVAVVGPDRQFVGLVTPRLLVTPLEFENRPRQVGGMATPFGVYLTTGAASGGVPMWALIASGAYLFGLFFVGAHVALFAFLALPTKAQIPWIYDLMSFVFFLLALRLSPLAKIHAAEHMTVHAIEQNEAITPEVVARMPRVHPRCGTNLAIGASLFLGVLNSPWPAEQELRLLIALLVTVTLYRPLGSFVQMWGTTAPAKAKHIALGVAAGRDLLQKYENQYIPPASVSRKLLHSGILQIMVGATLAQLVALAAYEVLRVPATQRVISALLFPFGP